MSIFFRKSIHIGKFARINLSKHGIGYSVGVKGARIGRSSTGQNYAVGGKDGIYFKENLNGKGSKKNTPTPISPVQQVMKTVFKLYVFVVIAALIINVLCFKGTVFFWTVFIIAGILFLVCLVGSIIQSIKANKQE